MMQVRRSEERGYEDKGWLQTYHTFSFDTYYDPDFLSFRELRVINEDRVKGGKGFGSHPHKEMEILTYVLEGALEHQDSTGHTSIIRPEEVQLMSAGTGIIHREYNLSHYLPAHFLQIWLNPNQRGLEPSYTKKFFSSAAKWGQWCLICSSNGREGSIRIHQDCEIYATLLNEDEELLYELLLDRYLWIQVISGKFLIQETVLNKGDALFLSDEPILEVRCLEAGELLLFDLA